MHIHPCQQQKGEKNQSEDLEMDKIKTSDAMVLTSAQIRTYKAAFHRSRDESANNDNDAVVNEGERYQSQKFLLDPSWTE